MLDEALEAAAATTTGLPEAFVHPDFVPVNAIGGSDDLPDDRGLDERRRGPRIWSLGFVLVGAPAPAT